MTAERRRVSAAAAAGGPRDIISITNLRKQYDNSSKKVCEGPVAYLSVQTCINGHALLDLAAPTLTHELP